jgi:hypothetical protein
MRMKEEAWMALWSVGWQSAILKNCEKQRKA